MRYRDFIIIGLLAKGLTPNTDGPDEASNQIESIWDVNSEEEEREQKEQSLDRLVSINDLIRAYRAEKETER